MTFRDAGCRNREDNMQGQTFNLSEKERQKLKSHLAALLKNHEEVEPEEYAGCFALLQER